MTSYEQVYNRFMGKIEDTVLANMSATDQSAMLLDYLTSALALIEADGVSMSNDFAHNDSELHFEADLLSAEIEGIALYMVAVWYDQRVNALEHWNLIMGSKDEKWTNQKDHWNATANKQEMYLRRARKCFRNYNYKHGNDVVE